MVLSKSTLPDAKSSSSAPLLEDVANAIKFQSSQGVEVRATVLKVTPQSVIFEVCTPESILRLSEVLDHFEIFPSGRPISRGQAIASSLFNAGSVRVCDGPFQ